MTETSPKQGESAPAGEKDQPQSEAIQVYNLYQTADKIYTRSLPGFFRNLRRWTWIPLLAAYLILPWLQINGRQAVWFDLPERQFHVFWVTFWPQDFMLLAWLLIIAAFTLFAVTTLVGRVWCGFTCPQTVWTMLFMGAEEIFEGDRHKRIRRDKGPWNFDKIWRKSATKTSWFLIAFVTGFTFVAYFTPARQLIIDFFTFSAHPAAYFWVLFFTGMTFMNAGFLREQVCMYMCPYSRFQSVMYDADTLVVSYDVARGEPRGARKRKGDAAGAGREGMGDCIDCHLCVHVCPVGIDIRDGLQYECISCGLCIDACDSVMEKMDYPKRLISFTTETNLKKGATKTRLLRPRLIGYALAVMLMATAFTWTMMSRVPLSVEVIRDRNVLFREVEYGLVENVYTLRIANMDQAAHDYVIDVTGDLNVTLNGETEVSLEEGEVLTAVVRLRIDPGELPQPTNDIAFVVTSTDGTLVREASSRFIGPRVY